MKKTCKALPALTMVVSILPMTALAEETVNTDNHVTLDKTMISSKTITVGTNESSVSTNEGTIEANDGLVGIKDILGNPDIIAGTGSSGTVNTNRPPKWEPDFFMGSLLYNIVA